MVPNDQELINYLDHRFTESDECCNINHTRHVPIPTPRRMFSPGFFV